jgi:iron(III) transport system permease protein
MGLLLCLLLVAGFLFVFPIAMLVVGAFRNAAPSLPADWSLDAFTNAFGDAATYVTLKNSVILSASVTIVSTSLAVFFAFVSTRTNAPLRRLITPMMVMVLAMPPLFFALGWAMLGNEQVGLLNRALGALTGSDARPIDVTSWIGLVGVGCLKATSFGYLLLLGPFLAMDRSLEEASRIAGVSQLRTFFAIDVPVLAPAITGVAILGFVLGLEFFDVPLLLGLPDGIRVFSTQVYGFINDSTPPLYGEASALSLLLVTVVIGLVILQWRILGRRRFTVVTGRGYRTDAWDLRGWKPVCAAAIVLYGLLALVLPLGQLVLGSLQPVFGVFDRLTLANFELVLDDPTVVPAIQNTLFVSALGGLLAMALAVVIGQVVVRSQSRLRRVVELSTWMPWAVPGVVLSLGMAWAYLSVPGLKTLYATVWIVLLGLVVAATPLASRVAQGALAQISQELEESARISGAGAARAFAGITLRLIAPSFAAGWFVAAIAISGNLAIPILLSSPANETVPVVVFRLYSSGETAQAAAVFVTILALIAAGLAIAALVRLLAERRGPRRAAPAR